MNTKYLILKITVIENGILFFKICYNSDD